MDLQTLGKLAIKSSLVPRLGEPYAISIICRFSSLFALLLFACEIIEVKNVTPCLLLPKLTY